MVFDNLFTFSEFQIARRILQPVRATADCAWPSTSGWTKRSLAGDPKLNIFQINTVHSCLPSWRS